MTESHLDAAPPPVLILVHARQLHSAVDHPAVRTTRDAGPPRSPAEFSVDVIGLDPPDSASPEVRFAFAVGSQGSSPAGPHLAVNKV